MTITPLSAVATLLLFMLPATVHAQTFAIDCKEWIRDGATAQRVAMVDEVINGGDGKAAAVVISEWNYGQRMTDQKCFVTDKFGLPGGSRIPVPSILRVWRPSLPLQ
jgi:hypothetical protein